MQASARERRPPELPTLRPRRRSPSKRRRGWGDRVVNSARRAGRSHHGNHRKTGFLRRSWHRSDRTSPYSIAMRFCFARPRVGQNVVPSIETPEHLADGVPRPRRRLRRFRSGVSARWSVVLFGSNIALFICRVGPVRTALPPWEHPLRSGRPFGLSTPRPTATPVCWGPSPWTRRG